MDGEFPNEQQVVGSSTCGPVSLVNIYKHFGKTITLEKILSDLKISDQESTFLPQLGRHILKELYKAILLTANTSSVAPDWKGKSVLEIEPELKEWLTHHLESAWLPNALQILFYLQEGGDIRVCDLSKELLDDYLNKDYVLLTVLEESWLWGKRKIFKTAQFDPVTGATTGHFVVIFGKKENEYAISDPFPTHIKERHGVYFVSKDTVLNSCLLWGGQVLAIKK